MERHLPCKPGDLVSISRTHIKVEGENNSIKLPCDLRMHVMTATTPLPLNSYVFLFFCDSDILFIESLVYDTNIGG